MTRAWEHAHNFQLFEDVLPGLDGASRARAQARLWSRTPGATSTSSSGHHGLDVDAAVSSGTHGKTKPHPTIFQAALERLDVEPADAVMVGDSIEDDVEGANAVGMRGLLLDRENRYRRSQ
jgi:putative hydrolase of the HAD superfamily